MRVGIDVRPLQLEAYRERGIGTHLRGWIEAAQQIQTNIDFRLLYDPALSPPKLDLTAPQWQMQPLALAFSPPLIPQSMPHIDPAHEFLFDSAIDSFLLEQEFDLFHATYTLMSEAFAARRLFKTRWVATFYDLIPLLFPKHYLQPLNESGKRSFAQRLGATVYAQRFQTISQATQKDLIKLAGVQADKIDVIYGGVDEAFRRLPASSVRKEVERLGIKERYIFSVLGIHHTKNLRRLLAAYSHLSAELRKQYQLIIRCPLSSNTRPQVEGWLKEFGIEERTILLGRVSKQQLVALYNGATVLCHPALYEGLGLPVLEGMRCGTPVVTSNLSAMAEVAGEAAVLVDPYQPTDIARGISKMLQSPTLQSEMRARGFKQAAQFSWQRTATAVLDSYHQASQAPLDTRTPLFPVAVNTRRRLRLSFWSPLNPCPSGISDYSESLLAELGNYADVDLFVDGYQPNNLPLFDSFAVFDARAYPYLAHKKPYDLNIYQIGNNPLHAYMYEFITKYPGVITIHDVYLYHFIHSVFLADTLSEEFWQEVAYCHGEEMARRAKRDYPTGETHEYALPLNKRLIEVSRGVIVHNQWAKQQVEQHHRLCRPTENAPPVCQIPMGTHIVTEDKGQFRQLMRRFLALPEDGFVFGVFGHIHRIKRIETILKTFRRVRQRHPKAVLFMQGSMNATIAPILKPYRLDPLGTRAAGIHLDLSYVTPVLFLMAMQTIDVGLNLRYPTVGETSATLQTLLGQGKPTIVSNTGSYLEYPDTCCPKVPVTEGEEEVLYQQMMKLIEDKQAYRQAVQAAYQYAQDKSWYHCAQMYLDFAEKIIRK